MSSEARQSANADNARLSTGPRTDEGKARSSQNARKHGLTAAQFVIAAEDRQEFDELLAQLQTEIRPQGGYVYQCVRHFLQWRHQATNSRGTRQFSDTLVYGERGVYRFQRASR